MIGAGSEAVRGDSMSGNEGLRRLLCTRIQGQRCRVIALPLLNTGYQRMSAGIGDLIEPASRGRGRGAKKGDVFTAEKAPRVGAVHAGSEQSGGDGMTWQMPMDELAGSCDAAAIENECARQRQSEPLDYERCVPVGCVSAREFDPLSASKVDSPKSRKFANRINNLRCVAVRGAKVWASRCCMS